MTSTSHQLYHHLLRQNCVNTTPRHYFWLYSQIFHYVYKANMVCFWYALLYFTFRCILCVICVLLNIPCNQLNPMKLIIFTEAAHETLLIEISQSASHSNFRDCNWLYALQSIQFKCYLHEV